MNERILFHEKVDEILCLIANDLRIDHESSAAVKLGVLMEKNMRVLKLLKSTKKDDEFEEEDEDHDYGC